MGMNEPYFYPDGVHRLYCATILSAFVGVFEGDSTAEVWLLTSAGARITLGRIGVDEDTLAAKIEAVRAGELPARVTQRWKRKIKK